jgi:hypothetical protein
MSQHTESSSSKQANNSSKANNPSKANNSLVAFLGAIKFRKPDHASDHVERYFAQLHPRARQRRQLTEENKWVRSAN